MAEGPKSRADVIREAQEQVAEVNSLLSKLRLSFGAAWRRHDLGNPLLRQKLVETEHAVERAPAARAITILRDAIRIFEDHATATPQQIQHMIWNRTIVVGGAPPGPSSPAWVYRQPTGPSAADVLANLARRGISVNVGRDGALIASPASLLTEADKQTLKAHKPAIVAARYDAIAIA